MRRVCVFCGSYSGVRADYAAAARAMAAALVRGGLELVYGGGRVVGVIPQALVDREVGHDGLTEIHVVETMHARKKLMADLSDAFVALPGGLGTIEEIFEIWTWAQLGMHQKPCGFLDVAGYYAPLAAFLDHATREGFVRPQMRGTAIFESDPGALLRRFAGYTPPAVEKWIDRART